MMRIVLLISLTLFALPGRADEADPFQGKLLPLELVMEFRQQIELGRDQQKEIGRMAVELQQSVAAQQWQMQSAYFDLLDLMEAEVIDEEQAVRFMKQAIDAENAIKVAQVQFLIRVRNLLDRKQVRYLQQKVAEGWQAPEK